MNIIIKLDQAFQPFADNNETVEIKGDTVKECLNYLISSYPIFNKILFNAEGTLSALVMVENKVVVPKDVNQPVSMGQEIILLPMMQGG